MNIVNAMKSAKAEPQRRGLRRDSKDFPERQGAQSMLKIRGKDLWLMELNSDGLFPLYVYTLLVPDLLASDWEVIDIPPEA